jgi:hypothetical protein
MPSGKLYHCPYFGCNQTSSRRWNMDIHIKRKHGIERPASTYTTDRRSVLNRPDSAQYCRESFRPCDSMHDPYHHPDLDSPPRKEESAQDRLMATISKNNEYMRLLIESRELSTRVSGFNLPQSLFATLVTSTSFQSKQNMHTKKVILPTGYRVSFCDSCFSGCKSRPVSYPIEFEGLTKLTHECNPKDYFLDRSVEEISEIKSQIQVQSINILTKVVDSRIGQGEAYLKIVKVLPPRLFPEEWRRTLKLPANRSLIEEKDCIEIDPSYGENHNDHWFSRAIKDFSSSDKLKITRIELKDFLSIAKATFGVFRFNARDPGTSHYYLIYVAF